MSLLVQCLSPRFLAGCPSFRLYPLPLVHRHLTTFNPSIAMHGGSLYFATRHANMLATGNLRYGFGFALKDQARDFVNETSFGILRVPEGHGTVQCELFPDRLREFEDVRIFRHAGRWRGLGCLVDRDTSGNFPAVRSVRMHLLTFDDRFRLETASPLPSPVRAEREKNWVPFPHEDELRVVYRPAPFIVLGLAPERRQISLVHEGGAAAAPWSGSSQFVPYGDGTQLGVIHRRNELHGDYVYEHAFMRVGPGFATEISESFHIMALGIEFCAGLVVRDTDILLSFGSHSDSRAFLARLSKADVEIFFRR